MLVGQNTAGLSMNENACRQNRLMKGSKYHNIYIWYIQYLGPFVFKMSIPEDIERRQQLVKDNSKKQQWKKQWNATVKDNSKRQQWNTTVKDNSERQ